jgi:peptidoglycan/LPS O-acetylase OafA/YrhL
MTRNDTSGLDTGAEYRPEVDGLRAIAVVSVIIFHLNAAWLPGGFAGVDVFFVISGYLMTRIIRGDIESGRFSFARFWARRIRRIYPALLVVVVAVLMVQHYLGFRPDEAIVGRHAVAAIASYSNVYLWREDANYWGTDAEHLPFLHTWSLSIEEQFYLLLPLAMVVIARVSQRLWLPTALACVAGSMAGLWLLRAGHPAAAFYLLPTRAWELGFGAAAALWDRAPNAAAARGDGTHRQPLEHGWEHRWPRLRGLLANAGLAAIVWAMTSLANFGFRLLIPVLGTVLLLTCGQSGSVARMLGWRPLVHIGRLSYSLYLWHWPLLCFWQDFGWPLPRLGVPLASYCLASATYVCVESTTRRREGIVPSIIAIAGVIACAAAWCGGRTRSHDVSGFASPRICIPTYSAAPDQRSRIQRLSEQFVDYRFDPPLAGPRSYTRGGVLIGADPGRPQVVVLGNSHALMWSDVICDAAVDRGLTVAVNAIPGVPLPTRIPPQPGRGFGGLTGRELHDFERAWLEAIARWRPCLVIIGMPWDRFDPGGYDQLLAYLERHAGRIVLVEQPPRLAEIGSRSALQFVAYRGIRPSRDALVSWPRRDVDQLQRARAALNTVAAGFSRIMVLETADLFDRDGHALVVDGDEVLYQDDNHLTVEGAKRIRRRLDAILDQACTGATVDGRSPPDGGGKTVPGDTPGDE